MLLKIFSVYDSKVGAYMQPFFMRSKGEAIRGFTEIANDGKSSISVHPEDYTLFELGEFFDDSGVLSAHKTPISIGLALDFVRPVVANPAAGFSRDDVN